MPYGLLYFYVSGTNDDKTTFADVNEQFPNTQPLVLNGDGSVPNCFYSGSAKVILITNAGTKDVPIDGEQQWERDPVSASAVGAIGRDWDAISIYEVNAVVEESGVFYVSIINANQNNNPASTPTAWTQFDLLKRWNTNETYKAGDPVTFQNLYYTSLTDANTANQPDISNVQWQLATLASDAFVFNTTAQTITTGVSTIIDFDSENFDDNNYHDNSTNNSRLTTPTGTTRISLSAQVAFASDSTGNRQIILLKNGAGFFGAPKLRINAVSGAVTELNISSGPLNVIATDYFDIAVFQNSGGDLDVQSGALATWFKLERLK